MLTIALTGGIGSGKSTVAKCFAALKAPIIDADDISHSLAQPDTSVFKAIVHHFGNKILQTNGTLDRKRLLNIVFDDENQRRWLENLLHPLIYAEIRHQIMQMQTAQTQIKQSKNTSTSVQKPLSSPSSYCIVVIPLLFETNATNSIAIDRILVISTTIANQIQRVTRRNNLDIAITAKIIMSQVNDATRLMQADDIIYNNRSLEELQQQVIDLHAFYSEISNNSSYIT